MGEIANWQFQLVAAVLFMIGTLGVLVRRNIIVMFMCIELMLNAANCRWSPSVGSSAIMRDRSSSSW